VENVLLPAWPSLFEALELFHDLDVGHPRNGRVSILHASGFPREELAELHFFSSSQ
jgi:hypothetical protein